MASRRAIVDLLEIPELQDLKAKDLQPEEALQILRDEPKPAILDKATHAVLMKQYRNDLAQRQFYLADKQYSKSFAPNVQNVSDDDIGRGAIERFKLVSTSKPATASTTDAYNNHVITRRDIP